MCNEYVIFEFVLFVWLSSGLFLSLISSSYEPVLSSVR